MVPRGGIAGWREDTGEMYRVWMGKLRYTRARAKAREKERERKREDIFARRVAGERNEWRLQTTRERRMVRNPWRKRGRDKGEENSPREEDQTKRVRGGRTVSRRQSPSTVAGVPTG